ncbi:DUF4097 domain-containing protein [Niallia circulans]|uniref:DUF4097 family beta strand repeat-containing protein n=1 Tax=Niallia circulans TaxID=1397 RepID=UPI001560D2C1|nr:DUF4097 family beta strand repeat-containing protein [Niallia circulans]NRG33415.1 DUF4097 domain-containing protein [Niallia circulans]
MADEKKRILELVESGKLTVDEALKLMEKVDEVNEKKSLNEEEKIILEDFQKETKFHEKKKETSSNYGFNFQAAKDKLFDIVDTTIKKVKEVDLDLNFGHFEEVSHIFQYHNIAPKKVDIDIPNGEVELIPWDQEEVSIECKAKVYRVNSLEEAKKVFLKEVDVIVDEERLVLKTNHKWMKVKTQVYIPQISYESAIIRLFNGPITTFDVKAEKLYAKTANGKITLKAGEHKKVEADAANGSIKVEKGKMEKLDAETINGSITVDGYFNKVDLQAFNGSISCVNHSEACEILELQGTTGSIEVSLPESLAVSGELKTNFGGFNVELEGIQIIEEKNEVLQKTLQFKSIQSSEHHTKIEANTKTGSIKVKKIDKSN